MTHLLPRLDAWIDRWLLGGPVTWESYSYGTEARTGAELVRDWDRRWRERGTR